MQFYFTFALFVVFTVFCFSKEEAEENLDCICPPKPARFTKFFGLCGYEINKFYRNQACLKDQHYRCNGTGPPNKITVCEKGGAWFCGVYDPEPNVCKTFHDPSRKCQGYLGSRTCRQVGQGDEKQISDRDTERYFETFLKPMQNA